MINKRVICLVAIVALAISGAFAKQSEESATELVEETAINKKANQNIAAVISESPTLVDETDPTEESEELESNDHKTSCNCNKKSKDEARKPEIQALDEKESQKKSKKSGKKFRVITISIPVEPEGFETGSVEVVEEGREKVKDPEVPVAVDVKEPEEIGDTTPTSTEEEVVEVTKSKKQSTMKTKLEKKRSKRQTKGKDYKDKSSSKGKSEKKSKKGKNKK